MLVDHGCQTELPGAGDGAGTGAADANRRRAARRTSDSPSFDVGAGSAAFAEVLLWGVVGAAVIALLAAIVRGGLSAATAGPTAPAKKVVTGRSEPPAPADAEPDPAALAAAGEFAAALRALLQRAFVVVHGGRANIPLHATSRELLRRAGGKRAALEPIAGLVATVEHVHFGGRPADRALYDATATQFSAWESQWRAQPPRKSPE